MTQEASFFIQRWQGVQLTSASELASSQTFILELCALLDLPTPLPSAEQDYMFERPITFAHGDGSSSAGRIDCYKRGHFVWESKKLRAVPQAGKRFDLALLAARSQAENYARALPSAEISQGRPPFLIVADVGNVLEIYADFSRSGATYTPFPDPRHHRIKLADLQDESIRERLRQIWLDPLALDPSRASARVTREVSEQLAQLAKSLEQSGHRADHVAAFLTRCLFSMFAEDVELLPKGSFIKLIGQHGNEPATLKMMLQALWASMDSGGFSAALATQVLKFNGKLFKGATADGYSLLMNAEQIQRLAQAAKSNWREVEPAIFGTLLERALHVDERHALGAHYTPRAYVERLVLPTVVEPLRQQWQLAQASALVLAREANDLEANPVTLKARDRASIRAVTDYEAAVRNKWNESRQVIKAFHHELCQIRILDPACGSGNFLYVALEHLKRLEGEVFNQLADLGEEQSVLDLSGETVSPRQLLGIELNERAAALAELVLWIGYLQWHIRTRGNKAVAEPVVHDFGNIECRDAVLAWDDLDLAKGSDGRPIMRWDGKSFKIHPVTGNEVPDESQQTAQWEYIRPKQTKWPKADYIVGNPPYLGARTVRKALGDDYLQALRKVHPDIPENVDFVMYWWDKAAKLVSTGKARQFGLITTNSLRQSFNRAVLENYLPKPLSLIYCVPDHPWVDSSDGAAVRVALSVAKAGLHDGLLCEVVEESPADFGEVAVAFKSTIGVISPGLTVGVDVGSATALASNAAMSCVGYQLTGKGFVVDETQARHLDPAFETPQARVRPLLTGRDIVQEPRSLFAIDLFGLDEPEIRSKMPAVYQWIFDRVKPERDQNQDSASSNFWWLYARPRAEFRPALVKIDRFIVTSLTAKHRLFVFTPPETISDSTTVMFALDEAFHLGVMSSRAHVDWAMAAGGRLGVGNDSRYNKSRCFETFPFPEEDTGLTPSLRERIASLAEQIDAHRKRQQAAHPGLTLTGMYNVLEALRLHERAPAGDVPQLSAKEKLIHTQGLVAVLKTLHDELDSAVLAAYGLPEPISTDALLESLVQLNAQRAREEAAGRIRWLRPAFQNPALATQAMAPSLSSEQDSLSKEEQTIQYIPGRQADLSLENTISKPLPHTQTQQPWPAALPAQILAVARVLASAPQALALPDIEAHFKGRGAWKNSLPRILETLQALGKAIQADNRWRSDSGQR
jgi:hypothetical protein